MKGIGYRRNNYFFRIGQIIIPFQLPVLPLARIPPDREDGQAAEAAFLASRSFSTRYSGAGGVGFLEFLKKLFFGCFAL